MTGVLPHNHGVLQVEHCVDEDQSVLRTKYPHWAQHLSNAGFRTGYFGKWHIERSNRVEDFGWQVNGTDLLSAYRGLGQGPAAGENELLAGSKLVQHITGPDGYNPVLHYGVTDVPVEQRPHGVIAKMAGEFLSESTSKNQPWACCVSFSEPNTPLIVGREAFEKYDVDAIRLPENRHDNFSDRPALYHRVQQIFQGVSDQQWRESRAVYFALISEIDQLCGGLIDQLDAAGQLENTLVVVLGDHGRYMGSHGFDAHNFGPFEEIYNVPMIMAGPGLATGVESNALVGLQDFGPTILEYTGAEPIDVPDSRSFAPLLPNPTAREADYDQGFAEYHGTRFPLMQRILWQGSWKFIFNGFDYDELYDLENDPHEMKNLARDPAHAPRIREMMAEIWRVIRDTDDRAILETHYSPMRFAAVGPNFSSERQP